MISSLIRSAGVVAILATVLASLVGCDGSSVSPGIEIVNETAGTNLSGVDMSEYDQVGQPSAGGGSVALPDGTRIIAIAGSTDGTPVIGMRPSARAPDVDIPGTVLSSWTDAAVSTLNCDTTTSTPFVLQVPVTPPAGAADHPGLVLTLVLPGGETFPISGLYNPASGLFMAAILTLPPEFQFAVTFNPDIQRLDSADVPDDAVWASLHTPRQIDGTWSTVDFVIDFDGQKITLEQAKKVARAARNAARTYSAAGFVEPFLLKETGVTGERWHIHLSPSGSYFDSNHDASAEDQALRFGRLFVGTARIDSPTTDNLGSVQASIAHEMFHSIVFNYRIPYQCFNYVSDGKTLCYRSYAGFNEGGATAIGYTIDQGTPKPRPAESPSKLEMPIGYFDSGARWKAYTNQDFFVYLLRIGGLSNVEKLLRSLTGAVMPGAGATTMDLLAAYGTALESGGVGLDVGFTEMVGGYTANRGFIREPEGYIWPDEPNGGTRGQGYVLDRSLFGANSCTVGEMDCLLIDDDQEIECQADLFGLNPFSSGVFSIDLGALADEFEVTVETVTVSVETTDAALAFWVVGEIDGKGESGGHANAMAPGSAVLPLGDVWSDAHIMVAQGAAVGDATVTIRLGAGTAGLTFEGSGTVVDTFSPAGGQPGICTQTIPMRLEIDHLPGWADLTFTDRDVQFGFLGSDGTCTVLDSTWNESVYNTEHPEGSFSLGYSPSSGTWLNGTYDDDTATGYGIIANDQVSTEISFTLSRVR